MTEPVVYTVTELAQRWKMGRHKLADMIKRKEVAAIPFGKRGVRVHRDEVARIESQGRTA